MTCLRMMRQPLHSSLSEKSESSPRAHALFDKQAPRSGGAFFADSKLKQKSQSCQEAIRLSLHGLFINNKETYP